MPSSASTTPSRFDPLSLSPTFPNPIQRRPIPRTQPPLLAGQREKRRVEKRGKQHHSLIASAIAKARTVTADHVAAALAEVS
jgi:hypothetical protein